MPRSVPFGASLPKGWPKRVRSAVVHAMSLAHATLTTSRGWAANHWNNRFRLKIENERLRQEVALLEEEIRIKDSRMLRIPGHERPHYPPIERLAILDAPRRPCLVPEPDRGSPFGQDRHGLVLDAARR
jgi:hypothetical protein